MAKTLYIGSDVNASKAETIFSEHDFLILVRQYMGDDAARYVEEIINERDL